MARQERLAKQKASKKYIAAKGAKAITYLFLDHSYLMKLCEYFRFSWHNQPCSNFLL